MSDQPNTETRELEVAANRRAAKYTFAEKIKRVVWMFVSSMHCFSPRPCFGWRRMLLRMMGAKIGRNVNIYPTTRIYFPWMLEIGDDSAIGEGAFIYNLGQVTIGKRATISHQAHLCAGSHDYSDPKFPLLKPPIEIGDDAWVCADAFVGPGVKIGNGAVVGARAAVFKDVQPWTIVRGNPAVPIKMRVLSKETK